MTALDRLDVASEDIALAVKGSRDDHHSNSHIVRGIKALVLVGIDIAMSLRRIAERIEERYVSVEIINAGDIMR